MLPTPSRFPAQVHDVSKPHHPQKRSAHRPTNNQSSGAHCQEVHYAIIVVNRHICHYPFTVQVVGFEPTAFRSQSGRADQAAPHPVIRCPHPLSAATRRYSPCDIGGCSYSTAAAPHLPQPGSDPGASNRAGIAATTPAQTAKLTCGHHFSTTENQTQAHCA